MGSVVGNDPGTIDATEATFGVKGPPTNCRWYACDICSFFYPVTGLVKFEGKRYCVENGCYKDIQGIIKERLGARMRVPNDSEVRDDRRQ